MTVDLNKLDSLTRSEAIIMLNNMMLNYSKVRIQVNENSSEAQAVAFHEGETVDNILDILLDKIADKYNTKIKIEELKLKTKDIDMKGFHALGYDDTHIETNLNDSVEDIKEINLKFINFVKSKKQGDNSKLKEVKEKFFLKHNKVKERYHSAIEDKESYKLLNKSISSKQTLNSKMKLSLDEYRENHSDKPSVLSQVLKVAALAGLTSKVINWVRKR